MPLCHVNVACGELDWGYQVQGSHSNNNNKAGKQEREGKKRKRHTANAQQE